MDRRSFLFGALAGILGGALAGGFAAYGAGGQAALSKIEASERTDVAPQPTPSGAGRPSPPSPSPSPQQLVDGMSYAQQGEDLIIERVFERLNMPARSYIDIGAHDPIESNNTYNFYLHGTHGVLVEPNPFYAAKLRAVRPLDKVVEAGIGVTDQSQADYYVIRGDGQLNTFSKEQADEIVKKSGPGAIEKVMKIPLLNVNEVLAEAFPHGGPDLLSIDTEGLDYDILRTLDFARFRPLVICAETAQDEDGNSSEKILELLRKNDYVIRGSTYTNTVFVDRRRLPTAMRDAGH